MRVHRNALVHDFGRITSHFLYSPEGRVEIKEYALGTCGEAFKVCGIFHSLIDVWTEELGIHEKLRSEKLSLSSLAILEHLRKTIGPNLDKLFFQKSGGP